MLQQPLHPSCAQSRSRLRFLSSTTTPSFTFVGVLQVETERDTEEMVQNDTDKVSNPSQQAEKKDASK